MKAFYWFLVRSFIFYCLTYLFIMGLGVLCVGISDYLSGYDPLRMSFPGGEEQFYLQKIGITSKLITGIYAVLSAALFAFLSFKNISLLRQHLVDALVMDNPNSRSMHTTAVPRGAGWGLVIPILSFLFLTIVMSALSGNLWHVNANVYCTTAEDGPGNFYDTCSITEKSLLGTGMLLGLLVLTVVSWIDDRKGLSAKVRILAQLLAVTITYFAYLLPDLSYLKYSHLNTSFEFLPYFTPLWLCIALPLVIWLGFINLYNFMDGIDGITAIETITLGIGILTFFFLYPDYKLDKAQISSPVNVLAVIVPLCCVGFLFHNWHPAKIFLGDIGSVTIGYLMGFFLLVIISAGFWYVALTLPLYYLADGGITLARRILRGEKFWEAHRTHFYQRAAQAAGRHDVVVLKIAACNVVLIGIAMLELLVSPWFVLAAPLPVALLLHNMAHQRHIGVKSPNG